MRYLAYFLMLFSIESQAKVSYNVYRMPGSGNIAGWGPIDVSRNAAVTGVLGLTHGGTGNTTGTSTVNANLTGPITSIGNATSVASQTGTGNTFVMQASPTLTTPNIGLALTGGALTFTQSVTPATPAAGLNKVYSKSDDKFYSLNSAGVEKQIGSAGDSSNALPNGSFEDGLVGWTSSGGTFATTTAAGTFIPPGTTAGSWDSSAAGQTLTGAAITVGGLAGSNGELTCMVQVPSGTATHTLGVWDGTTLSSVKTISNSSGQTTYAATTINFVIPASGTVTPRFTSVNINEPLINIDDCYVGKARNIGSVSQAVLYGVVKITGCAGSFQKVAAGNTLVAYTAQTGCSYAVENNAVSDTAFGTAQLPSIKFASMPAGDYRIEYDGYIGPNGSTGTIQKNQFTDGTTTAREISYILEGSSAAGAIPGISQSFSYTAPKSNVTWQLFSAVDGGNNTQVWGTTANPGVIKVWYFPSSSQQAVSPQQADYGPVAYTPNFGSTLGAVTNVSFFQERKGAFLHVYGTFNTGSVSSGSPASISLPTGLNIDSSKISLNNTTGNGGPIVGSHDTNHGASGGLNGSMVTAIGTSTSLVYFGIAGNSTALNTFAGNGFAFTGDMVSVDFRVPIQGWIQTNSAPLLVGSVTSKSAGPNEILGFSYGGASETTACSSSPCTIYGPTDACISSVTRSSAGNYIANFASGCFSSAPRCTNTGDGVLSSGVGTIEKTVANSSTQMGFGNLNPSANTHTDGVGTVLCIGPR